MEDPVAVEVFDAVEELEEDGFDGGCGDGVWCVGGGFAAELLS